MKRKGNTGEKFITPLNHKNMKGYFVKVPTQKTVYVSEREHGKNTLKKAIEIRNEIMDKIKYPYKFNQGRKTKNSTGIVGVRELNECYMRLCSDGRRRPTYRRAFVATGRLINGKLEQKYFRISVYGRKMAFEMAKQQREKYLEGYQN